MKIDVDKEFYEVCRKIIDENKSIEEWRQIESSDMFQTKNYCGGYDATEDAFCFSYFDQNGVEFWFQLTLKDIEEIINLKKKDLGVRQADI